MKESSAWTQILAPLNLHFDGTITFRERRTVESISVPFTPVRHRTFRVRFRAAQWAMFIVLWALAILLAVLGVLMDPSTGGIERALLPPAFAGAVSIFALPLLTMGIFALPPDAFTANDAGIRFEYSGRSAVGWAWNSPDFRLDLRDVCGHAWRAGVPGPEQHWFLIRPPTGRSQELTASQFESLLSEARGRGMKVVSMVAGRPEAPGFRRTTTRYLIRGG